MSRHFVTTSVVVFPLEIALLALPPAPDPRKQKAHQRDGEKPGAPAKPSVVDVQRAASGAYPFVLRNRSIPFLGYDDEHITELVVAGALQ